MKKRVLSLLLAAGMIFGSSAGGHGAVLAAGTPQDQTQSASDRTVMAPEPAPDESGEPETTAPAQSDSPETETTTATFPAGGTATVTLEDTLPNQIFTGQEELYWNPSNGLLLSDYYTVKIGGKKNDEAKSAIRVKAVLSEDKKSYTFTAQKKTAVFNEKTYDIDFKSTSRKVTVNEYDPVYNSTQKPQNFQDVKVINQNGIISLQADSGFYIAADSKPASFTKNTVPVSELTDNAYYLRYIGSDKSVYYKAISKQYTATVNKNLELSAYAVISEDIDLSKTSAYNGDITVTVKGYAMAEKVKMTLKSGETTLTSKTVSASEKTGVSSDRNTFKLSYTFALSELAAKSKVIKIEKLKAIIEDGSDKKEQDLSLSDIKMNTRSSLILDGDAPVVVYQGEGEWNGWNYAQFTVRDFYKSSKVEGCGIKSIAYSFDGDNWIDAPSLPWNKWRDFKEGMTEFTFAVDASVTKQNGEVQVVFRAEDLAGNFKTISRDEETGKWFVMKTDSKDPVIKGVEVYYDENGMWLPLTPDSAEEVFEVLPYGTFTKYPLQFRIWAEDPLPEEGGDASGISSVTAGGKACTPNMITRQIKIPSDTDLSEEVIENLIKGTEEVVDYYYYDLEPGVYSGFEIKVTDNGGNTASRSLADVLDNVFGAAVTESGDLYYDTGVPDLTADAQKYVKRTPISNRSPEDGYEYWYNREVLKSMDRQIAISFSDENGLYSVDVEFDGGKNTDYSVLYRNEKELKKNGSITIPISAFTTEGSHSVRIVAQDNAGNVTETTVYLRLDYTPPELQEYSIGVSSDMPDGWCRSDSLPVIALRFADANPESAVLSINGQTKTFNTESGMWARGADNSVIVTLDLANDLDDSKAPFSYGEEQIFSISGTLTDGTGNELELEKKRLHVDTKAPAVFSVSVDQTETASEKLLRVLTFGIFSNEKFQYTVEADDGEYESGIAAMEIQLEPEGEFFEMTYSGLDDVFTYVIPKGDPAYRLVKDESYQGTVVIRVADRVGRTTTVFAQDPDTSDDQIEIRLGTDASVRTKSNAFMLENIAPKISVTMPDADSEGRTAERWYALTDAENKIIKVSASDMESGLYEVTAKLTVQQKVGHHTESKEKEYVILSPDSVLNLDTETYKKTDLTAQEAQFDLLQLYRDLTPDVDGRCEFTVTAIDLAGNTFTSDPEVYFMDWKTPVISSIDLKPESADRYGNTGDYPGGEQFVDVLEYGFYFRAPFTATVNVSDDSPSSGMDRISYRLVEYRNNSLYKSGDVKYASVNADGKASFEIPADFKGQIYVSPFDNVGNTPEAEVTPHSFIVDTPERHASEDHISVTGFTGTTYKDAAQHPLYTGNVTLTVRITDTVSGIRSISYAMRSELHTQEEQTIEIPNTGCRVGQPLRDGWSIAKMDENLVTEVERVYGFSEDDNAIGLSFRMTDRSGNTSVQDSEIFSIDQTAPVIQAEFHPAAGSGAYYSQKRTATITVTERNFDASRIRTEISNRIGGTPSVSFRDESDTVHIAELEFDEGDYSFSISGTDLCDHAANVTYSGGNENEFYVDLRDPVVVSNFSELVNGSRNSFRSDQKVTFSITEHNFVKDSVRITVERAPSGKELNSANRVDCTNEFVTRDMWTDNGDVHTAGFTFSKDAVYRVTVSVTDAAGRSAADTVSPIFEVDKKKPVLDQPANLSKIVYTKKSTQTEADPIVFADENIDHISYSVVSYRLKRDADQVGYGMDVTESETLEVKSNSVTLGDEYFSRDGIYEVKCVAYDVAGNLSDSTTHTYVVQRDSDFLVYIPDSSKEEKTGLYKFNQIGIRSADFEDIRVIAYVTSDREFGIQVDGEDVTGEDISISQITGDALGGGKREGETINQITAYDLTLKNSYIAQKYGDETIDTDLLLNAVAASSTDVQKITLGHIYIDNVKPVGEYESALQDLGFFGGFYGMDSRAVKIEGVSPDIDLTRSEIQLNDTVLTADAGGFVYDEDAHTIGFTLGKGYTDIKTTLVDNAGNTYVLPIVKKVYVGGLFARFWYLFLLGGLALIAVPVLAVVSFLKKKRAGTAY